MKSVASEDLRVLPTWYSDNYFSLLPDESRTFELTCKISDAGGAPPEMFVSGWNVLEQKIS
jgi:hypothetical protein